MKKTILLLSALLPAAALAGGGTVKNTANAGGALSYATTTVAGSDVSADLHGGWYVVDSVLVGGDLQFSDNEAVTTWELTAMGRYHFIDPWLLEEYPRASWLSPYVAVRLGAASGDNGPKSETGAVLGVRLGTDFFLSENVAIDLFVDAAAATADVYPDESKMESTELRVHVGLDFFF